MFERVKLPYEFDELEPHIDAETVKTHYEGHHKTYMEKFNELVNKVDAFKGMELEEILRNLDKAPSDMREGLKNNGGGLYNHNLYFESLTPESTEPSGELEEMINDRFGSLDDCLKALDEAATVKLFGSGYAWLVAKGDELDIVISKNQDLPEGDVTLLLPLDMWEHAYYLKQKNKKKSYVEEFCKIINWDVVAERLEKGPQGGSKASRKKESAY